MCFPNENLGEGEKFLYNYFLCIYIGTMAFVKKGMKMRKGYKKPVSRKTFAKRAVSKAKTASLVKLIKKVSLRQVETKDTHIISENQQLYHNTPYAVANLLYTEQGINDNESGTVQVTKRIGDEICASGISIKLWFANKLDRPDVIYKMIVFKYKSNNAINNNLDPYESQGTSNFLIRDLNVEKFKIVRVINFRISTSAQRITTQDVFNGAEGHKAMKVWIPLKQKIKYESGTSTPFGWDYAFSVVAYDSYGTLTTDNIASFAVNRKLYFKDP